MNRPAKRMMQRQKYSGQERVEAMRERRTGCGPQRRTRGGAKQVSKVRPREPEAQPEGAETEEEEEVALPALVGPGDWYVVHTYAGYENKVKANLHSRIGSMQMEDKIFDVVIPMEDVMEIKGGKKQVV